MCAFKMTRAGALAGAALVAAGLSTASGAGLGVYESPLSNTRVLKPGAYHLHWDIIADEDGSAGQPKLRVGLEAVGASGFMGVGLSEPASGGMPGSDMLIARLPEDESAVPTVEDRWAEENARPFMDTCQHWTMTASFSDGEGGWYVEAERVLDTGDAQDRVVLPGGQRVVWSFGSTDRLEYHGPANRGMTSVDWFSPTDDLVGGNSSEDSSETQPQSEEPQEPEEPEPEEPSDPQPSGPLPVPFPPAPEQQQQQQEQQKLAESEIRLIMDYEIPNAGTTYACQSFDLPRDQGALHATRIRPVISPELEPLVHHMILHSCDVINQNGDPVPENYVDRYREPGQCVSPVAVGKANCQAIIYAWGRGGNPLVLPPQAGIRIGDEMQHSARYAVLEVHYDNPERKAGLVDTTTGVVLEVDTNLREHDAGVIALGDPFAQAPALKGGQTYVEYETTCPGACTSTWKHEINVYANALHMHARGRRQWSTHWRPKGQCQGACNAKPQELELLREMNRIEYYDWELQQQTPVQYTVKPGDTMNLHCGYNTMGRNDVKFGVTSELEMCQEYLMYWPILIKNNNTPFKNCGTIGNQRGVCASKIQNNWPFYPDPKGGSTVRFARRDDYATCSNSGTLNKEDTFQARYDFYTPNAFPLGIESERDSEARQDPLYTASNDNNTEDDSADKNPGTNRGDTSDDSDSGRDDSPTRSSAAGPLAGPDATAMVVVLGALALAAPML